MFHQRIYWFREARNLASQRPSLMNSNSGLFLGYWQCFWIALFLFSYWLYIPHVGESHLTLFTLSTSFYLDIVFGNLALIHALQYYAYLIYFGAAFRLFKLILRVLLNSLRNRNGIENRFGKNKLPRIIVSLLQFGQTTHVQKKRGRALLIRGAYFLFWFSFQVSTLISMQIVQKVM